MAGNPLILDIRGNSLDDGPGIRTVVFFKGCPLSCIWCHNPESKSAGWEIGFAADECVGCNTCLTLCPEGALARENPYFIDRSRCTLCFTCADACPSGALSRVGSQMPAEEIVRQILRDKPFFDTSGGGVTLSGGEPTRHMGFLSRLLRPLKDKGVHTLLETCGLFDFQRFCQSVLPWTDTVYFDIKLMDAKAHRQYCGAGNDKILDNFEKLAQRFREDRSRLLPRTPLIPDITATEENLTAIAAFLGRAGMDRIQLMAYNPLWLEKNAKIGEYSSHGNDASMATWMSPEKISSCRAIFNNVGIHAI
ncbi:MAG: glycyl-radical enzyme activating protein [Desulfobacterales bacterium]|nr:glycyl-radical enzyme activating protein [Desulfobacterales bacterium]